MTGQDLIEYFAGVTNLDEAVDSYINTSTHRDRIHILETIGDTDLSNPQVDLTAGWYAAVRQMAYNAVHSYMFHSQTTNGEDE